MKTGRMEAFSDGVIAVIITIMVLDLKVPHTADPAALLAVLPSLLVYALSFATVAIMWVNHHHFLARARRADPALLWANNNLLFWMSLIPFVTGYLGENGHAPLALAVYAAIMTLTSAAFLLLVFALASQNQDDASTHKPFRNSKRKAALSMSSYALATGLAFYSVYASYAIFILFPLLYFWPESKTAPME